MTMRLSATREIERPAADVFAFVADSSNNPRWQRGQRSCTWTTPPPIDVGSTYDQEASFLGRRVLSSFRVVEYEPGWAIAIESYQGTFPIRVRRSVDELGPARSRVTADISGEPGGVLRLAAPLVRRVAQRSVDADYDRLKKLLEAGGA